MVERYSHQDSEHIQAAVDKLEGRVHAFEGHFSGLIKHRLHIKRKGA